MRILHICLANFYIDNYGYQENFLPIYHKKLGYEVSILASTETYVTHTKLGYVEPTKYLNSDGIHVTRLPYAKWLLFGFLKRKLRVYNGVAMALDVCGPDIIFMHDVQTHAVNAIIKYINTSKKNVQLIVDGHADYTNSARNWVSKNLLHKVIYRYFAQKLVPYTSVFWGTLPCRIDFMKDVYKIPMEKLALLVMGLDDTILEHLNQCEKRDALRIEYGIKPNELILVTGGKLDRLKNLTSLVKAVVSMNSSKLRLLIVGEINVEVRVQLEGMLNHPSILYVGWKSGLDLYMHFSIADLAVFPGKHSVLWEQVVGMGLPALFKYIDGHKHVDIGGNCIFMQNVDENNLRNYITNFIDNPARLKEMQLNATSVRKNYFLYSEIAKRSLIK